MAPVVVMANDRTVKLTGKGSPVTSALGLFPSDSNHDTESQRNVPKSRIGLNEQHRPAS